MRTLTAPSIRRFLNYFFFLRRTKFHSPTIVLLKYQVILTSSFKIIHFWNRNFNYNHPVHVYFELNTSVHTDICDIFAFEFCQKENFVFIYFHLFWVKDRFLPFFFFLPAFSEINKVLPLCISKMTKTEKSKNLYLFLFLCWILNLAFE